MVVVLAYTLESWEGFKPLSIKLGGWVGLLKIMR